MSDIYGGQIASTHASTMPEHVDVRTVGHWTPPTKEVIIDFRKNMGDHAPLYINGDCVERVTAFKFLGVHISETLSWSTDKEGPAAPSLSESTQEKWVGTKVAGVLLSVYYPECVLLFHHYVVCWEFGWRQEVITEGHTFSTEDHRLPSALPRGDLQYPVPQEGRVHYVRLLPFSPPYIWSVALM